MKDGVIGVNPTFETNEFNRPKFLTESQTFMNDVIMLLFGRPGFYPSIPTLGINIGQYLYQFSDDIDTESIKTKIIDQCSQLGTIIDGNNFDIVNTEYEGRSMLIIIFPDVDDDEKLLTLGITSTDNGNILYKFKEVMNSANT